MYDLAWAPLVHGRTAFVDFRSNFIVSPEAFDSARRSWAQQYVLAATRMADLKNRPLWCLFGDRDFRVAGVVCNASSISADMIREEVTGRPLFVFLGYVQRQPGGGLPRMDLESFAPLYSFVRTRWLEKFHNSQHLVRAPFDLRPPMLAAENNRGTSSWNFSPGHLGFWPLDMAAELWNSATDEKLRETSCCFGSRNGVLALDSPFLNVCAADVSRSRLELRYVSAKTSSSERKAERRPKAPVTAAPRHRAPNPPPAATEKESILGHGIRASSIPSGFRAKPGAARGLHPEPPPAETDAVVPLEPAIEVDTDPMGGSRNQKCRFCRLGLVVLGAVAILCAVAASCCRRS